MLNFETTCLEPSLHCQAYHIEHCVSNEQWLCEQKIWYQIDSKHSTGLAIVTKGQVAIKYVKETAIPSRLLVDSQSSQYHGTCETIF